MFRLRRLEAAVVNAEVGVRRKWKRKQMEEKEILGDGQRMTHGCPTRFVAAEKGGVLLVAFLKWRSLPLVITSLQSIHA